MTTIINHDVRVVNGKTLYMPPWAENQAGWGDLALPDISVVDTVQQYPLGTKLVIGDRSYRYAKAGGTLIPDRACKIGPAVQQVPWAPCAVALQYATTIVVTVGATDGVAGNGVIAVNELAGGYIVIFRSGYETAVRRQVVSNTAVASGGGTMTVVVDEPIPYALTASDNAELISSPYRNVVNSDDGYRAHIGVPQLPATVGEFLWIQTWGPCWMSPQSDVGGSAHDLQVVFKSDGSLLSHAYGTAAATLQQHAGFVMANVTGGGQGAPFVFLQITP